MRLKILILSLLLSGPVLALDAQVTLDRSWGLLIGDRVTASVTLPVAADALDSHSLPQHHKRYGPWLYLHDTVLSGDRLTLDFQIINVPAENREVSSPQIELRTLDGDFVTLPAVPMQIGSFLPAEGAVSPRPDAALAAESTHALQWRLISALTVLLVSLLVWLVWHFGLRPRGRLPFANTLAELNRMRLLGRKDGDAASRSLHHAFNRSAGRVVIHSDLDALWRACPWLAPLQADIESFYRDSASRFFSRSADDQHDFDSVRKLARACRERERLA